MERAVSEFGHLDLLVNNAAFQMTHDKITEIPSDEWDHTFRTNIYAMFYLCKAALPVMRPGGAITNTASIEGYQPDANLLAYATTKGAIVNFTKGLAAEAIQSGIRVNAVAPGPVWTPLIPSTLPPEMVETFGAGDPAEASRPARRACPGVCVPVVPGSQLHHRHDLRHHRRRCDRVANRNKRSRVPPGCGFCLSLRQLLARLHRLRQLFQRRRLHIPIIQRRRLLECRLRFSMTA